MLKLNFMVFLCFTTIKSDVLHKMNNEIQSNVIIETSNTDDNILNMKFKESEKFYILIHYPQKMNYSINKIYAFYTALNCKFADWTMSKIKNFVERSPLFYQPKFQSYENVKYEKVFDSDFQSSMKILVNTLDEYVERFINIINNFLDTNPHITYYNDTSILETLVSIKIKMNYVSLDMKIPDNIGSRYFNIIRLFVKEMTTLQNVLSLNCTNESISYNNSQFYGYWISVDDVENSKGIDVFFSNVKKIKLESNKCLECKLTSMFLEMFIKSSTQAENEILIDIANVHILDQNENEVSIQDIFDHIQIYYDVELIYWYQNFVLTTIMKLILSKIRKLIVFNKLPPNIQSLIKKIYKKISKDPTKIPVHLVDGFTVLAKSLKKPLLDQKHDLSNFLMSLDMKIIKCEGHESSRELSSGLSSGEVLTMTFIEYIMEQFDENFNYLVCLQKYHRGLRDKYNTFYILPLIKNQNSLFPSTFILPSLEITHNKHVCMFLINVYSLCYDALMMYEEGNDKYGSVTLIDESSDVLGMILRYFYIIVSKPTLDRDLSKMALKIIPLLVNMLKQFGNGLTVSTVKRILNVIMNELNINGIKYCSSSQTVFLLFNNINFLELGNHKLIETSIMNFFQFIYVSSDDIDFKKNYYDFIENKYFILSYIYQNLIEDSNVYKSYENDILFYWKGQKQNIKDIYNNIAMVIFNPYTFYAFSDIIYTFYVAAFFSDMLTLVRYGTGMTTASTVDQFDPYIFPNHLKPLVVDIKRLLSSNKTEFKKIKQNIAKQLRKFNVVLDNKFFDFRKICKLTENLFCFTPETFETNIEEIKFRLTFYGFHQNVIRIRLFE